MSKLLWIMLSVLMALPIAANAEVYKWKDKDGNVRYSDTPPPSNVQQMPVNGKKTSAPVPFNPAVPAAVPAPATPPASAASDAKKKPAANPEGDVVKRQEQAEVDKKNAEKKEADLKIKQQNCANAKTNYNSYKIGGRMTRTNEKGEREYLSDADIAAGVAQAQKDMDQYCSE